MKLGPYSSYLFNLLLVIVPLVVYSQESEPKADLRFFDAEETRKKVYRLAGEWDKASLQELATAYNNLSVWYKSAGEIEHEANADLAHGRAMLILGSKFEAAEFFEKANGIALKNGFTDIHLSVLCEMFLLNMDKGNIGEQLRLRIEIERLENSANDPKVAAFAAFALAEFNYYQRNIKAAVEFYTKAVRLGSDIADQTDAARYKLYLGYAYLADEDYANCLENLNSSLEISNATNNKRGRALAYIALGHALNHYDDKQGALDLYKKAEEMFPAEIDLVERARLFNGVGKVYEDYGEFGYSLVYRKKAFETFKLAGHIYGQTATLPTLGVLSYKTGDFIQAESYFHQALEMTRLINDDFGHAVVREDLGTFYLSHGNSDVALDQYQMALKYFEKIGENYETALIKVRMSQIYFHRNKISTARELLESALSLNQKVRNKFSEAEALFYLASLEKNANNTDAAIQSADKSLQITEELTSRVSNSRLKTPYFSNVADRYELYINLLMKRAQKQTDNNFVIKAFQSVERSRARAMLENLALSEADFTADADPGTVRKEKEIRISLNAKSNRLIDLLSRNAEKAGIDKLDTEINELQYQLEDIKADLKQKSPIYSAIKDPPPFDVGEFQSKVLDENSILLEYSLGKEESYLWVVGKTEFNSYVLPPREQIESRIERLRGLLDQNVKRPDEKVNDFQTRVAEAEAEYLREAQALSIDLLGQAADKLAGKRLIVVADGKIHYFPLAALPFPNSTTDDPILLTNEVVYEPSAAALMLIKNNASKRTLPQKDLFLVSDPVFSKADERLSENGGSNSGFVATVLGSFRSFDSLDSLPRLPASMDEANSITQVVGSSVTTARSGFAANRENVLNAGIADYKVVHFATHGLLDEKRPELSGIVLSLFDEAGKVQDGGFIRLQDVYGMNLNADLVVLSACDTGLGKEIKGEGLMSLNNAFLQAGAKSVVSSLWRVEDTATKQLMTDFYRGMAADGLTSSEALRQAQIKLYKDPRFASPFYWASFTAQGNFSTAPQFSSKNYVWIYILGLVLVSVGGLYLLRRARNRKTVLLNRMSSIRRDERETKYTA
jgi:CHAT domain-containing protein/Tfp pilus assembly protein PilF